MARDGYLILDSDLHMMEPDDLWAATSRGRIGTTHPGSLAGSGSSSNKRQMTRAMPIRLPGWRCRA